MKRYVLPGLVFIQIALCCCSIVPITGRRQLDIIPDNQMMSTSYQQYSQFMKEHKLSDDREMTEMVKRVGRRIQNGVENYFSEQGMKDQLKNYSWEFNLIESEEVNAWAMPGGKVVIYTGILPVTMDERGLAVVMGHEIAHAVAKHGDERLSYVLITQMGGMALSEALENAPDETRQLWMAVYGVGTQIGVLLPYSRTHENEADHLGLIFMAMAGYNPRASLDFWQRMLEKKEGPAPPEFLSTHPAGETRINNIQSLMPEAMKYYNR
ncbi:MAG: M48 family metallopeptidase [Candidatus Krumholzibacteriales bacterium]